MSARFMYVNENEGGHIEFIFNLSHILILLSGEPPQKTLV